MSFDTEDMLREGLTELGEQVNVPAGLGIRAHARWRRRRVRRQAQIAGVVAVVAAIAVVRFPLNGQLPGGLLLPSMRATAYIVSRVTQAVETATSGKMVEYATSRLPADAGAPVMPFVVGGMDNPKFSRPVFVQRYYRGLTALSFYARPGAEVFAAQVAAAQDQMTTTWVTYPNRTWWRGTAVNPKLSASVWCSKYPDGMEVQASNWRSEVRDLLSCPYVEVSHDLSAVNGQKTIELMQRATVADSHQSWNLWVNPITYLPVRLVTRYPNGYFEDTKIRWLRPTPANLAPFKLIIPQHFRRVAEPVG